MRISGAVYEAISAAVHRRPRQRLFHTALVARSAGIRYTIEMAPVPDEHGRQDRGVVAEGTVGSRWLRPLRIFRYEVRCWADGQIPDLVYATASPARITVDPDEIRSLLDLAGSVPTPVWGRDELRAGDMWNSNSVTSWLLASNGSDIRSLEPPHHGRAPGWHAGIIASGSTAPATEAPI